MERLQVPKTQFEANPTLPEMPRVETTADVMIVE